MKGMPRRWLAGGAGLALVIGGVAIAGHWQWLFEGAIGLVIGIVLIWWAVNESGL
jgi:hypothetical protein